MRLLDLSFSAPEQNLACDEVLLDLAEQHQSDEMLRFWQSDAYFVVVGYANRVGTEVNVGACEREAVSILRRCSGGGTVLQGPGCLNYSLILRIQPDGPCRGITSTNHHVLRRHQAALSELLGATVELQGHTDLALAGVKFSGNAQRRKRDFLLFHGSFLVGMDIARIEQLLPMPSKAPEYRLNRPHGAFLTNLKVSPSSLRFVLAQAWGATEPMREIPYARIQALATEKYQSPEWNLRF